MNKQERILNITNRKKIYETISNYPGLHLRSIVRKTKLAHGTVRYHLRYLEKKNLINANFENGYKRYFALENIGIEQKKLISLFREKTPRFILIFLLFYQTATKKQLCKELDKKTDIINYYLNKLMKEGFVKQVKPIDGIVKVNHEDVKYVEYNGSYKENIYILKDYTIINKFLITNKDWFFDTITKQILDFNMKTDKLTLPLKIKSHDVRYNKLVNKIINRVFDVFPPPYQI